MLGARLGQAFFDTLAIDDLQPTGRDPGCSSRTSFLRRIRVCSEFVPDANGVGKFRQPRVQPPPLFRESRREAVQNPWFRTACAGTCELKACAGPSLGLPPSSNPRTCAFRDFVGCTGTWFEAPPSLENLAGTWFEAGLEVLQRHSLTSRARSAHIFPLHEPALPFPTVAKFRTGLAREA